VAVAVGGLGIMVVPSLSLWGVLESFIVTVAGLVGMRVPFSWPS
jgi:hypothetical protein